MKKVIKLFFLLLISAFIFIGWKKEFFVVQKEKTKKVKIFDGKFTVPFNWRLTSNKLDSFLIAESDTIKFSREMPNVFIPVLMIMQDDDSDTAQHAENKRIKKYNDSLIKTDHKVLTHCMDSFHAKNSTFWIAYLFPCKEEAGNLTANIFIRSGGIIGVTTSKVNPSRATQLIEILKTFQPKK
jgi:hypothetical protein